MRALACLSCDVKSTTCPASAPYKQPSGTKIFATLRVRSKPNTTNLSTIDHPDYPVALVDHVNTFIIILHRFHKHTPVFDFFELRHPFNGMLEIEFFENGG